MNGLIMDLFYYGYDKNKMLLLIVSSKYG
jgi:hypothetical protein